GRARQACRRANARRAIPNDRWPHPDPEPLYRVECRPEAPGQATQPRPASATAATHHRTEPTRSPRNPRRVVETSVPLSLILLTYCFHLGKLGWGNPCPAVDENRLCLPHQDPSCTLSCSMEVRFG